MSVHDRLRVVTRRLLLADVLTTALAASASARGSRGVVLFDGELPTTDGHVERLVAAARQAEESVAVVFCPVEPLTAAAWIELGACAVLTSEASGVELQDTIERLADGDVVLGVAVREGLLAQLRAHRQLQADRDQVFTSLTRREREVLTALAMGNSPEEIARTSYVSMNTVRTQIRNVLSKLDVASVAAAVSLAHRSRWLGDGDRNA